MWHAMGSESALVVGIVAVAAIVGILPLLPLLPCLLPSPLLLLFLPLPSLLPLPFRLSTQAAPLFPCRFEAPELSARTLFHAPPSKL